MSLLVSDSNITHWIHPSNFQTEDGILSKEKKENQPILSSKKCEDIYHLLLNFFFPFISLKMRLLSGVIFLAHIF